VTAPALPLGRPARVGIVGLGQIYELTIRAHRANPDTEVVALCDTSEERLAQRRVDWPDAQTFTDYDAFLAADLDVVEVLVPTPAHCDIVVKALAAGRHVNVQKPFANSLDEADLMLAAGERSGAHLRVMENFVHYEPLRRLKAVVDEGTIGEPAGFHMKMVATGNGGWDVPWSSWEWQFAQARAGRGILVFDDGWHKFSVAMWLFGPVREVMAWIGRTEVVEGLVVIDAPSTIMWTHANGVRGVWDITFAPDMLMKSDYYTNDERFEVTGRSGFVRVNRCTSLGIQQPVFEVYRDGEMRSYHALDDDWGSSFDTQGREYYRWLVHGGPDAHWSGEDARAVLTFIEAAYESARENRPVVLSAADHTPGG
jgi:predicted dehydrogenase